MQDCFAAGMCSLILLVVFPAMLDAQQSAADPLASIFEPALAKSVDVALKTYRTRRKYRDEDFPMPAAEFAKFRDEVSERFTAILGLKNWRVKQPVGKQRPLAGRFVDQHLKTIKHHGIEMEVHVIEISETGITVPAVICLPNNTGQRPGICVFSGHSPHGLRDLVLDLSSYQSGAAVRLANAGFVTIAVEKIDAGYLSRDGARGADEDPLATFGLYWGQLSRAHQLMACLAASEILAAHPRVDNSRIGATGVSLGGWLSVQTAMLSDRIQAVADFGVKTVTVAPGTEPEAFQGMSDLCHILPGMLAVCDRNLMSLAYCPRPMLAGHGRQHATSHAQGPVHYRSIYEKQYAKLGFSDRYEYRVHDGGDTMPIEMAISYFRRQFDIARRN